MNDPNDNPYSPPSVTDNQPKRARWEWRFFWALSCIQLAGFILWVAAEGSAVPMIVGTRRLQRPVAQFIEITWTASGVLWLAAACCFMLTKYRFGVYASALGLGFLFLSFWIVNKV